MKLKLDLDKCIMAGECYYNHPKLFDAEDDGTPKILVHDITEPELIREAEEAVEVCPSQAITLEE